MIDAKTIEELQGLLAKATPGPWKNHLVDDTTIVASNGFEIGTTWPGGSVYNGFVDPAEQHEINAALIVAMRNALPALLDLASKTLASAREGEDSPAGILDVQRMLTIHQSTGWLARDVAAAAASRIQPKGGDANARQQSAEHNASPGVTAGASAGEDGELCKRLEATRDGVPFGWASSDGRSDIRTPKHLINPEGPEAAARIRALTAENEALRRERDEAHADAYTTDEDGESVTWQELCAAERAVRHHNKSRAESSEALVAELREKVERLRKALEPFAKAASDYERQGEFFSDNIELVLRVSVFAAPEYHNSTAVQVGDLRRARSELEAGHE